MAEVAAKQRKHKMSRLEKKNTLIAYSFLAPNFLGFAIFTLVPVVCAILLAFVEWNGSPITPQQQPCLRSALSCSQKFIKCS